MISEEDAELGNPMEDFRDGDIIVAAMINPAWLPYFCRAGGFVSEVGGWLSHPAILAREYDVAMIVGTEGIGRIAEGDRLRLNPDGRIEVVAAIEPRRGGVAASAPHQAIGRRLRAAPFFYCRIVSGASAARDHRAFRKRQANCRRFDLFSPNGRRAAGPPAVASATIGIIANARIAAVLGQPQRIKSKVMASFSVC